MDDEYPSMRILRKLMIDHGHHGILGCLLVCFLFFSPVDKFSGCYLPEGSNSGTMTLKFLTLINIVYQDNRIDGTF